MRFFYQPQRPVITTVLRFAQPAGAARCFQIESIACEGDEAATFEKLSLRIAQHSQGLLILEQEGQIIGFINSGCAYDVVMSDEAFKELVGHDPMAPNVVIMSLVLNPAFQAQSYASLLMGAFIDHIRAAGKQSIHLMCKDRHVDLYKHFG